MGVFGRISRKANSVRYRHGLYSLPYIMDSYYPCSGEHGRDDCRYGAWDTIAYDGTGHCPDERLSRRPNQDGPSKLLQP